MGSRIKKVVLIMVLAVLPVSALATVDPLVTIAGYLEEDRSGAKGTDETFFLVVKGHRPELDLLVEVQADGEALDMAAIEMPVHLNDGSSFEVPIPLTLNQAKSPGSEPRLGVLQVRVRLGTDTLAVQHFHFSQSVDAFSELDPEEFEQAIERRSARQARLQADALARDLLAVELRRGNQPVRSQPVEAWDSEPSLQVHDDANQQAWDALAGSQQLNPGGPDPCNRYSPQGNHSYRVTGQAKFRDDYYSPAQTRNLSNGYPISLDTQVRYANVCGDVFYSVQRYSGTTGSNGSFDISVTSHVPPGGVEPVVAFRATAPESGLLACGLLSCGSFPVEQSLTNFSGTWQGGNRQITPIFSATNSPYPFFFRWNEEINSLQSRWATAGFGGSFTRFTVGYWSTASPPVSFQPNGPGVVIYDSANRWRDKWTMAHEFGHQFQYTLQGNQLGGGGPHTVCQAVNDGVGFVEGFADWHGNFWETEARHLFFPCSGGECWSTCDQGYRREGNVMAFFWDLFDNRNDANTDQGLDAVVFALSLLKSWNNYASFPSFYNDFTTRGLWAGQAAGVASLRSVNRLTVPQ